MGRLCYFCMCVRWPLSRGNNHGNHAVVAFLHNRAVARDGAAIDAFQITFAQLKFSDAEAAFSKHVGKALKDAVLANR